MVCHPIALRPAIIERPPVEWIVTSLEMTEWLLMPQLAARLARMPMATYSMMIRPVALSTISRGTQCKTQRRMYERRAFACQRRPACDRSILGRLARRAIRIREPARDKGLQVAGAGEASPPTPMSPLATDDKARMGRLQKEYTCEHSH